MEASNDARTQAGLLNTAARLCRDSRGSLAVWTSVMALPLALSVGVAMDIQRAGRDHSTLKATLDAAVLAAVNNNAIDDRERQAFAEKAFRDAHSGAPVVRLESSVESGAVSLSATLRTDLSLSSIVGMTELEVSARSTAYLNTPDVICALALNETEAGAVTFGDLIDFDARTCSVQSNSSHPDAILSLGTTGPVASNFCAHGGTTGTFQPGGTGECARVEDPYRNLKLPKPGACGYTKARSTSGGIMDLSDMMGGGSAARTAPAEIPNPDTTNTTGPANAFADLFGNNPALVNEGAPLDFATGGSDLVGRVEDVVRSLMGTDSADLKEIKWDDADDEDGGERKLHIGFHEKDSNPFGNEKKHHIWESDIPAFLAQYEDDTAPAEMQSGFDPSFGVATFTLGDGRSVMLDNDDSHMLVDTGAVLRPGTYCDGLTVAGADVTLLPGTYHMVDGPFVVKDTASVVGEGVTVILAGRDAHLKVESEGRLSLKAPKRGALKGLVVAEDTSRPSVDPDDSGEIERLTSRVTSGGELLVTGTVYLPTHAVEVSGDDSGLGSHAPSTSFIADTLSFKGDGQVRISVDHETAGLPPVQPRSEDGARLVE